MRHMPDDLPGCAARSPALGSNQDPADYRQALSCFATGVTVITARWQDEDWGMTCNSFASVSLEPRLVLWSIRKAARSLEAFTRSGGFTVSVLARPQQALARQFAAGDMAARSSIAMRISSAQSMSSGAAVTNPKAKALSASNC